MTIDIGSAFIRTPAVSNRVTAPSAALVDVLRYHAEWSTGEAGFAAEDMDRKLYATILATAVARSLVALAPKDPYADDQEFVTTEAGLAVIREAGRTDADALRDTQNHHQGSRVHAADADHGRQLRRSGLVGPRGGLTRRASIAAERLRNAALDDAFGPL